MPLLGAGDPLPRRPQRVLVAGTSGAGKTTLARAVAEVLGCSHVELFLTDRDHIVRWAWRTHPRTGSRVLAAHAARPELVVVRLTTPAQVAAWMAGPLPAGADEAEVVERRAGCAHSSAGCDGTPAGPDAGAAPVSAQVGAGLASRASDPGPPLAEQPCREP